MLAVSPSGVASLRARFEQKDESTSPPSRGRSPAASLSVTGDASRPVSKVRTSFVAVESSGQMGDCNASEELGNKGDEMNGNKAEESTMDGVVEVSKTNGIELTPQKSIKKEDNAPKQKTPKNSPKKKDSTPQQKSEITNGVPSADKPSSTAENDTAAMLSTNPKAVAAVSGEPALGGETSPLGSILKGSPFEQDGKKSEASNAQEIGAAAESTQSSEQQAQNTPMTNGKPKEAPPKKAGVQSNNSIASRPSAIGKKLDNEPLSSTAEKSEDKPQTSTLPAPVTPKNATTPSKQPLSKKVSPKLAASKEPKKKSPEDTKKSTAEKPSRPFVAPKASAAASKPAPKLGKKAHPSSPPAFTKPRPKSPTRPVRLPGSATAPTAASAAKFDSGTAVTARPRDRVSSNPTSLRQQPARTSLPTGSKPAEKAKDKPKSRLSAVSSKTAEGSFLDRMMRPTQSSSQKTHEKVEARTPPKKNTGVRPKRKSDGSEKAKSENVDTIGEQPTESSPSAPVQAPADSREVPSTNGGNDGTDEIAPAAAVPTPLQ
ncbi:hypothetical protein IMSHALPRED_008056 [Imshaugia aleurites]|uniref:Uncharacterized protein n=1 Tax=Imshaugia aleurites TaxID=172621 RepID=A0A8H3IWP6_9LECA|nr:hypothetical protein IMSHALPRED_008056 [Imshaugia aleurites]